MKKLLINISLLAGAVLLCLAGLELFLRAGHSRVFPYGYYRVDPKSGLITAQPHYRGTYRFLGENIPIETNGFGFRGRQFSAGDTAKRILIIGDSFVQAVQVRIEHTFGSILEQTGPDALQVMQAGIPGWGQGDEIRWLETYCDSLKPHTVILSVFLGNDLPLDNLSEAGLGSRNYSITPNGLMVSRDDTPGLMKKIRDATLLKSRLYLFLKTKLALLAYKMRFRERERELGIAPYQAQFLPAYLRDEVKTRALYDAFFAFAARFQQLSREKHFEPLVMLIPWHITLDNGTFRKVTSRYGLDADDYDREIAQALIMPRLEKMGIPCIDLKSEFEKKGDPRLAFADHFSITGHEWTARILSEVIKDREGAQTTKSDSSRTD